MENNINLDAHSSLIIADGSIVEINGQKVLLTLVRDADAPETKAIDLHKDSWAVYNDGSQRFKDTVVKWLNENIKSVITGSIQNHYYGIDKNNRPDYGLNKNRFTHILTLDEFCDLAKKVPCSDVTDTPPLPSLKYEDCYSRVNPKWYVSMNCEIGQAGSARRDGLATERQAKQIAALIRMATVVVSANGGDWKPKKGEAAYYPFYDTENEQVVFDISTKYIAGQFPFISMDVAQRAYEANKEIFHDYFGIGGENE